MEARDFANYLKKVLEKDKLMATAPLSHPVFLDYRKDLQKQLDWLRDETINKSEKLRFINRRINYIKIKGKTSIQNTVYANQNLNNDVIAIYEAERERLQNEPEIDVSLPDEGKHKLHELQLTGTLENLQNDLVNILVKDRGNGKPYMFEVDIIHFIYQNFTGCPGVEQIKTFIPNISKSELRYIFYQLYRKYGLNGEKRKWLDVLNDNFPNHFTKSVGNIKYYEYPLLRFVG